MTERADAGFAQLLVIGALAVMAAILSAAIATARLGSAQISALDARVLADARLTSGIDLLRDALGDPQSDLESQALAQPVVVHVGDEAVALSLTGEGGKIDVMRGDPALVARFAAVAGVSQSDAAELLRRLAERRAAGDDAGALDVVRVYLAEAVGFDALDESFTRFGSDRIDPAMAGAAVLRAIPDLNAAQVTQIIATPAAERGQYAPLSRYFASGSRRFMLVARQDGKQGQRFERRLPVELTASGGVIELDAAR